MTSESSTGYRARGSAWRQALSTFACRAVFLLAILAIAASTRLSADRKETISVRWQRKANQPQSLTVSPGGGFFGAVDRDGVVRFYDEQGTLLWSKQVEGATDVLIARNGHSLLVYSRLNPVHRTVHFFRRDGGLLWEHEVDGCVWAGAVTPDGQYAAVTTGEKYIYRYVPHPTSPRYRRWRLRGVGHCLTFTPDSKSLVVGTWQESTIASYNLDGEPKWVLAQKSQRQYELQNSGDGKHILGVRPSTQHTPEAEICLWDSMGQGIWRRSLEGFDVTARISPQSRYVAVSYATILSHKETDIIERKVAVYDAKGKLAWEKGGLFFGPRLIALSPTGDSVIVSDGDRSIYNIDRRGRILSKRTFEGPIKTSVSSEDGHRILLYCGDGWLYLLEVG